MGIPLEKALKEEDRKLLKIMAKLESLPLDMTWTVEILEKFESFIKSRNLNRQIVYSPFRIKRSVAKGLPISYEKIIRLTGTYFLVEGNFRITRLLYADEKEGGIAWKGKDNEVPVLIIKKKFLNDYFYDGLIFSIEEEIGLKLRYPYLIMSLSEAKNVLKNIIGYNLSFGDKLYLRSKPLGDFVPLEKVLLDKI